jgi:hypothetical protein
MSTVRKINDPFGMGTLSCMTLSIWNDWGDVLLAGCSDSGIIRCARLPFKGSRNTSASSTAQVRPESTHECAVLAIGPKTINQCAFLDILWPEKEDEEIIIMGQWPSYIRKDGRMGGNDQRPFVACVKASDIGAWEEVIGEKAPVTASTAKDRESPLAS